MFQPYMLFPNYQKKQALGNLSVLQEDDFASKQEQLTKHFLQLLLIFRNEYEHFWQQTIGVKMKTALAVEAATKKHIKKHHVYDMIEKNGVYGNQTLLMLQVRAVETRVFI